MIASTGGGIAPRKGFVDAMLISRPSARRRWRLATLKFNPSIMQIMRANLFGVGVGGAVLVLSALVLGVNFASPVPYILARLGAIGAKTVVSLLWAEAAEARARRRASAHRRQRLPGAPRPGGRGGDRR